VVTAGRGPDLVADAGDGQQGDGAAAPAVRGERAVSNATALFEVAGGGSFRTNEFRRVGYPSHIRESRFRFFGTEASMEQLATVALWQDKQGVKDISELLEPKPTMSPDDPSLQHIAPELRAAFTSGSAPVHDRARLPREFDHLHNGHEGSHHFLVDDFVTAVNERALPSVNAWVAARYTLPGIVAHESARQGGDPGLRGRAAVGAGREPGAGVRCPACGRRRRRRRPSSASTSTSSRRSWSC
jgi:hypothetical protein